MITFPKLERGTWHNAPPEWSLDETGLRAVSGRKTDFWQTTYYDFRRDDGHALLVPAPDSFTATLTFEAEYDELYDQAGLMLRAASDAWIKFGIEWTDGAAHLSSVATRGRSDWSAAPIELGGPVTIRATRLDDAILLQHFSDDAWQTVRLAPVPGEDLGVGPYLCSPEREGLVARFLRFEVGPQKQKTLHG